MGAGSILDTDIASIERHMRHTYILVLHSPPKNTTTSLLFSLIVLSPTMHTAAAVVTN